MNESVFIVVLNWNRAADTQRCIKSILESDAANYRVVIVDNNSTDCSVELIANTYPDIKLLNTGRNLGYAGGNNVGIRFALEHGAEQICILNNDVVVDRAFMGPLLSASDEHLNAGIFNPVVVEMDDPQTVWAAGQVVDWRRGEVSRLHAGDPVNSIGSRQPYPVDAASGAAMLIKKEMFERVGLLDETFFLYYEETDYCMRAGRMGYQTLLVPGSVIRHTVSASLGKSSPVIDYYMFRNHLRFIAVNWAGANRLRLLARIVLRNLLTVAAYTAKSESGRRLPHRNARLLALRDAVMGRWGEMGKDVLMACTEQYG